MWIHQNRESVRRSPAPHLHHLNAVSSYVNEIQGTRELEDQIVIIVRWQHD